MLIVAPAGCGKTEALALRVAGLIRRDVIVAPRRILVTTFSNRSTDNARQRLRHYLGESLIRDRVSVTNFHGLSARIIRAHASTIGMDPTQTLPDSDWVGDQFRARDTPYPQRKAVIDLFREVKQTALTDDQIMASLEASGNGLAQELEALRVSEKRLTYDDLPRLSELILQTECVAQLYREHFGAVIVDEFQDLTPQQLRIVNRISYQRTTFAGDLAQGIYTFAGARANEIDASIRAECSRHITFSESHRSAPAVLAAVNMLAHRTGGQDLTSADPDTWPAGGLATVLQFADTADEADWAVGFSRFVLGKAPNQRIGIMTKSAARRRFADDAFAASELPVHRWDDGVLDTETAKLMKQALSTWNPVAFAAADDAVAYLRVVTGFDSVQAPDTREGLLGAIAWACDLLQAGESAETVRSRIRVGDAATLLNVEGVHLLTGHVGKGQQFDWVIVVGLEQGSLPFFKAETIDELAEEARVLGVMTGSL